MDRHQPRRQRLAGARGRLARDTPRTAHRPHRRVVIARRLGGHDTSRWHRPARRDRRPGCPRRDHTPWLGPRQGDRSGYDCDEATAIVLEGFVQGFDAGGTPGLFGPPSKRLKAPARSNGPGPQWPRPRLVPPAEDLGGRRRSRWRQGFLAGLVVGRQERVAGSGTGSSLTGVISDVVTPAPASGTGGGGRRRRSPRPGTWCAEGRRASSRGSDALVPLVEQ